MLDLKAVEPVPKALWTHSSPKSTYLEKFRVFVNGRRGLRCETFDDLYTYSIDRISDFWQDVFDFSNIIHTGSHTQVLDTTAPMPSIPRWFPGLKLNIAENMLCGAHKHDSKVAVTSIREGNTSITHITWHDLRALVGRMASAMRVSGIKMGDRIAVIASNCVTTLGVFLATTSLGAIFTSTSTDMGTKGILDRLVQVKPRLVFMEDRAVYGGKTVDLRGKAAGIVGGLEGIGGFQGLVVLPRLEKDAEWNEIARCQTLSSFLSRATTSMPTFEQVDFNTPYLIAYSSGTTGQPKCIVHGGGGIVLSQKKELYLHYNVGPSSAQLTFTTTSWAMYNKSMTALMNGARVVMYDGSPFYPDHKVLLRIVEEQKITHLGISPRYLEELERRDIRPREVVDVSSLQMVNSTGAALLPQQYAWFYGKAFHRHTQLANSAGGTDTACSFALQNALSPVYPGELTRPGLAMKIEVFEQLDDDDDEPVEGKPVSVGTPGELVITKPFPTMPVMFWGEGGAEKYFNSYFGKFKGVWCQGDFIRTNPVTGGIEFLGRSDGVLNPSGIRFGSAEIYSVVQKFPQISESICVGQRRPQDTDESVFLFVLMQPNAKFTPQLVKKVKIAIRNNLSARHVPRYIVECGDIPVTINNKKVELPVKKIISGKKVTPSATLANPTSLKFFEQFMRVEELEAMGLIIKEESARL